MTNSQMDYYTLYYNKIKLFYILTMPPRNKKKWGVDLELLRQVVERAMGQSSQYGNRYLNFEILGRLPIDSIYLLKGLKHMMNN